MLFLSGNHNAISFDHRGNPSIVGAEPLWHPLGSDIFMNVFYIRDIGQIPACRHECLYSNKRYFFFIHCFSFSE